MFYIYYVCGKKRTQAQGRMGVHSVLRLAKERTYKGKCLGAEQGTHMENGQEGSVMKNKTGELNVHSERLLKGVKLAG